MLAHHVVEAAVLPIVARHWRQQDDARAFRARVANVRAQVGAEGANRDLAPGRIVHNRSRLVADSRDGPAFARQLALVVVTELDENDVALRHVRQRTAPAALLDEAPTAAPAHRPVHDLKTRRVDERGQVVAPALAGSVVLDGGVADDEERRPRGIADRIDARLARRRHHDGRRVDVLSGERRDGEGQGGQCQRLSHGLS